MMAAFNAQLISALVLNSWAWVYACVVVEYTPVGTPGDGGDKANVREKDGVIFDAIQGIVHLTEWQSVQLELELHLSQSQHQELTK